LITGRPVNHIRITTISKLNAEWSNKYHLQYNESCNKAEITIAVLNRDENIERDIATAIALALVVVFVFVFHPYSLALLYERLHIQ
jgi:hypothetical protein